MTHRRLRGAAQPACAGQASVEYLVVTVAIAVVLIAHHDTQPVLDLLAAAFKSFFGAYSFALSLP
jgi:Flp pilus assembly pilin Flp